MTEYVFAKCKDHRGLLYYLMAETVDEVYEYCDNYRTVPKGRQMDLFDKEGWLVESIITDKEDGYVKEFKEKEGKWFNYIKGTEQHVDPAAFNFQGLGIVREEE